MVKLNDLQHNQQISGLIPAQTVTLINVQQHSADAVEVVYRGTDGQFGSQLLFRSDEARLVLATAQHNWTFDADGDTLKLASEAYRIHLAHLFDERLAVHTSMVEPLPHQITAVYDHMLNRQPLRFLLADDPGAGKTIMAGLLIRELIVRGDVRKCLICAPGSLSEQWQDELWTKFQLDFKIVTRDMIEASRSGNPFNEHDLVIVRLDQVSRSDELLARLSTTEWDLIVCDEAHKMAASFFGGELKETQRYKLGKLFGTLTRHLLLMTATPHNGKEEDFQLFMALLDPDRFEGRFRDGAPKVDVSDLMRRMVKEKLLKFDGKPLFPERKAYTVNYTLSSEENDLYEAVTSYVREQFNRAEELENAGRKGTIGFALTILQRRLASSPEAIYQSLKRRRERLELRLKEELQTQHFNQNGALIRLQHEFNEFGAETLQDIDEAPDAEAESLEDEVTDNATTASTMDELRIEIGILRELEDKAHRVLRNGNDRKWNELQQLLQDEPLMRADHKPRKLVIFTEHRDTLNYLQRKITTLFGSGDGLVCIHGAMQRDERRKVEAEFKSNVAVSILLATDAAGEGINLQRAHLMVNYDLPWNPNRLEQRFGRIHRIGQTEVCHLWNLVAGDTREGAVYTRLLSKLKTERDSLDGQVFDVLGGDPVLERSLRDLMIEAIRYGDDPVVRARLDQAVDNTIDRLRVQDLLEQRSLVQSSMDVSQVMRIREDMERYAAKRLQPHYIKSFFMQAFAALGGVLHARENGRYAINHVPAAIRNNARDHGLPAIATRFERICFEKADVVRGDVPAAFICPGHPLLDAVMGLTLEKHRGVLKQGAVLIDETDPGKTPRVLFYLEQSIRDARLVQQKSERRVISREAHFVEIGADGATQLGGGAPYLDYRAASAEERSWLDQHHPEWFNGQEFGARQEQAAISYAIQHLAPRHREEVRAQRLDLVSRTEAAVHERLTKEIHHWDWRANELQNREAAGKPNARLNSQKARARADDLSTRLDRRMAELAQEREIIAESPVLMGGALIVPIGLLLGDAVPQEILDRRITEQIAMQEVLQAEQNLGNHPRDVSADDLGYDIESRDPRLGRLRFIEVKGRRAGSDTVTLTRNEILRALNVPEQFVLALVEIEDAQAKPPRYVRQTFAREPGANETSVNFDLAKLLVMSSVPE